MNVGGDGRGSAATSVKRLVDHSIPPVVIVGAGLAGLSTALHLADERRVVVLAKRRLSDGATSLAQGGIVGVLSADDSVDAHVADTLEAGAGLVDEATARFVSDSSAAAVKWLMAQGVVFTDDPGGPMGLHLAREGGHGVRRIAHSGDSTGQAIHQALLLRAAAHPNVELREQVMAVDLITSCDPERRPSKGCHGIRAFDVVGNRVETLSASAVVLATGGSGRAYRYTTNPDTATGDGVAMAWRAGCRVANMEFMQFHPTCLYHSQDRSFLISEALRGEGAVLRLPDGTRFMPDYDARAELAPRDIVARAIDSEMRRLGLNCVLLDATHLGEDFLRSRFPMIYGRCLRLGIDIARERIPVVPAAHYTCGGVITNLNGSSDISGLYAVGEAACTGLHGANRLASNSLLECVVLGRACAEHLARQPAMEATMLSDWDESQSEDADAQAVLGQKLDELRLLMWSHVGIVRSTRHLERALGRIQQLKDETRSFYAKFRCSRELLELRNLVECAELIVRSALTRNESRGLHYNCDYPDAFALGVPTVLTQPVACQVRQ